MTLLESIAVALASQIPFLVKFYFDHQSKRDALRNLIFDKHVEYFRQCSAQVIKLHQGQKILSNMLLHAGAAVNQSELVDDIRKEVANNLMKFREILDDCEILIPGNLVVLLREYYETAGLVLMVSMDPALRPEGWTTETWEEQRLRLNQILNLFRLYIGTDSLSAESVKLFNYKKGAPVVVNSDTLISDEDLATGSRTIAEIEERRAAMAQPNAATRVGSRD